MEFEGIGKRRLVLLVVLIFVVTFAVSLFFILSGPAGCSKCLLMEYVRDEYGCLKDNISGKQFYHWNEDAGACIHSGLAPGEIQAAKIAVSLLPYNSTVIRVDDLDCEGCFVVHIANNGKPPEMKSSDTEAVLMNWTIVKSPLEPMSPDKCLTLGGRNVDSWEDWIGTCNQADSMIRYANGTRACCIAMKNMSLDEAVGIANASVCREYGDLTGDAYYNELRSYWSLGIRVKDGPDCMYLCNVDVMDRQARIEPVWCNGTDESGISCSSPSGGDMRFGEAIMLALSGECASKGVSITAHKCDSGKGQWWIGLKEREQDCVQACIVDVGTKASRIGCVNGSWREGLCITDDKGTRCFTGG